MLTVRQIERLWESRNYNRLIDELVEGRAEGTEGIRPLLHGPETAAALAIVRMGELLQGHQVLVGRLVRYLISIQSPEGGFGDTTTTAICIRALAANQGSGPVITKALKHLETLQRDDGEWPIEPLRRMPGDLAATAFIIRQLIDSRVPAAIALVDQTLARLIDEDPTKGDHQLQTLRKRMTASKSMKVTSWS